jgi:hypothetical protein
MAADQMMFPIESGRSKRSTATVPRATREHARLIVANEQAQAAAGNTTPAPSPARPVRTGPTARQSVEPVPARPAPAPMTPRPGALDVPVWQWRSAVVVVAVVGVFAAVVSFGHIWDVAAEAGEKWAALMFVPVDGMALAASMTMSVRRRAGLNAGVRTWATFLLGVGSSLAFNVAAAEPTTEARLISALPSVSFLLTYELLMQLQHIKARGGAGANHVAASVPSNSSTGEVPR